MESSRRRTPHRLHSGSLQVAFALLATLLGPGPASAASAPTLRAWEITLGGALLSAPAVIREMSGPRDPAIVRELSDDSDFRLLEARASVSIAPRFGLQVALGEGKTAELRETLAPDSCPVPCGVTYLARRASSRRELSLALLPTWSPWRSERMRLDLALGYSVRETRFRERLAYAERTTGAPVEFGEDEWSSRDTDLVAAVGLAFGLGRHGLARIDVSYPLLDLDDESPGEVDLRWSLGVGARF